MRILQSASTFQKKLYTFLSISISNQFRTCSATCLRKGGERGNWSASDVFRPVKGFQYCQWNWRCRKRDRLTVEVTVHAESTLSRTREFQNSKYNFPAADGIAKRNSEYVLDHARETFRGYWRHRCNWFGPFSYCLIPRSSASTRDGYSRIRIWNATSSLTRFQARQHDWIKPFIFWFASLR